LVTDVGKIDDKSFNESGWNGLKRAEKDLKAAIKYIETIDAKDYEKNIALFGDEGYDAIVTMGFGLTDATRKMAPKYPKTMFIGVDQFQVDVIPNVVGLIFSEEESGFLGGCLAGLLTKSNIVAQVLGTDVVPPVRYFKKGYDNGAVYCNPKVKVLSAYHPGGLAKGFTDPDWGKQTALTMIAQKADVVFGAGGKTGNGALLAANEKGVLAIGVDTDQYYTLPEVKKVLVSSAMKMIDTAVFLAIKDVKDGKFQGGNKMNDTKNGGVGLAPFHDLEAQVPAAVKAKLDEVYKGLAAGTVKTGVDRAKD